MSSISVAQLKALIGNENKRNKFGAKGVWACPLCYSRTVKGDSTCHPGNKSIYFHSTGEYQYWLNLLTLESVGEISDLERQPGFELDVNGIHIAKYTADFKYKLKDGSEVVADFKGHDTYASKLLRKLTYAVHGIEVVIIK